MNKLSVVCFILLLTAHTALAATPISIGVKAGVNLASATFDPSFPSPLSTSGKTGFGFGAVAEIGVGGPVFIAVEPMYLQKGSVVSGGPIVVNTGVQFVQVNELKFTQKVGFLEIPILLKGKLVHSSVHPYGFVGPSIGITLSSTTTTEATGFPATDEDTKHEVKSTDFSVVFGAGAELAVNKNVRVTFDGRYALGLSNVASDQGGTAQGGTVKTRGIQFFAGVLFAI